ncbi:MAG: hypothetical protein IKU62_06410 [Ruminiclostridium sp.]|nr:hypothetical protein [Ruminiclostridium sp.]
MRELHQTGLDGEELLSRLYCRSLPDISPEQGDWMAHHVLEQIQVFDKTRKWLQELDGHWEPLGEHILHLMEGFTLPSQCRKLRSMNQAMDALDELCKGSGSLEEMVGMTPPGYRGSTGEKGRNAELHIALEKLLAPLNQTGLPGDTERAVAALRQDWMDDNLFRAVLTMVLNAILARGDKVLDLSAPIEYIALEVCRLVSASDDPKSVDSAAVKLLLTSAFLAGGTATTMLTGTSVAIYSVYYLIMMQVGRILS